MKKELNMRKTLALYMLILGIFPFYGWSQIPTQPQEPSSRIEFLDMPETKITDILKVLSDYFFISFILNVFDCKDH